MTAAFITVTVLIAVYSLWVRRDTWSSRWEVGATFAVAIQTCGLVLLTMWGWNGPRIVGSLFIIAGVLGNIYHMLMRLTSPEAVLPLMRTHLGMPLSVGCVVIAIAGRPTKGLTISRAPQNYWWIITDITAVAMFAYLTGYLVRLLLKLRHDHRSTTTLWLFAASTVFAFPVPALVGFAMITNVDTGPEILICLSISTSSFSYGLARSWVQKKKWFAPDMPAIHLSPDDTPEVQQGTND